MPILGNQFALTRCPHCNVDQPNLNLAGQVVTSDYLGTRRGHWRFYACTRCGGVVTAAANAENAEATEIYPEARDVDSCIPERAKSYLEQALNSLQAPSGAVMLAASAVDAMLKAKGYKDGSLYSRIDKATEDHVITQDMAKWAHQVRLEANPQRHANEDVPIATQPDAERSIDFALALSQFMFVLPARVEKGLEKSAGVKNQ